MTLSITHAAVVVTPDDGTSEVGSNEWNAAHTLTGTVGIAQGGTNATSFTSNVPNYYNGSAIASMTGASWNSTDRALSITASSAGGGIPALSVLPSSGASSTKIYNNGTMVVDADFDSGTYPLILRYNGSNIFTVLYSGAATATSVTASSAVSANKFTVTSTTTASAATIINSTAQTAAYTITLPSSQGNASTVLQNNGAGVLSWATAAGGSPGGANTQIQFNDSSAFGGDADFTWDKTNNTLTISTTSTSTAILTKWVTSGSTLQIDSIGAIRLPNSLSTTSYQLRNDLYATVGINIDGGGAVHVGGDGAGDTAVFVAGLQLPRLTAVLEMGSVQSRWHQAGTSNTNGIIEQRFTTLPQTYRLYNTYTDTSNFERAVLDWTTTANTLTFGSSGIGTGTTRKIAIIGAGILTNSTVLPTTDPGVTGQLWNSAGTVKVST